MTALASGIDRHPGDRPQPVGRRRSGPRRCRHRTGRQPHRGGGPDPRIPRPWHRGVHHVGLSQPGGGVLVWRRCSPPVGRQRRLAASGARSRQRSLTTADQGLGGAGGSGRERTEPAPAPSPGTEPASAGGALVWGLLTRLLRRSGRVRPERWRGGGQQIPIARRAGWRWCWSPRRAGKGSLRAASFLSPRSKAPGSAIMPSMIRLVYLLRRQPELSLDEFHRYWRDEHGPLVAFHQVRLGIVRYTQSHRVDDPGTEAWPPLAAAWSRPMTAWPSSGGNRTKRWQPRRRATPAAELKPSCWRTRPLYRPATIAAVARP